MNRMFQPILALAALALFATPLFAAEPLFASNALQRYWYGFTSYWTGAIRNQGAITLIALGTGAVSMFIITRAKWKK